MGPNLLARIGVRRASTVAVLAVALGAVAFSLAGPSDGKSPSKKGAAAAATASIGSPFFRVAYGDAPARMDVARERGRYDYMIMHRVDAPVVARLKAEDPNVKVLMYVDMMSADPRDPTGEADWVGWTDADANPDWFLKDRNGKRLVFQHYPTSRVMDVGNPDYQDAGVARVISDAQAGGFDGIFLDDANASLRWVIAGGSSQCVKYPTDGAWQAAVYSFFANVAPQLQSAGLLVVANIGGSTVTKGLWPKWNGPLDGAMEESYTNGGAGRDSLQNGLWQARLGHNLWSENHGKLSLNHAVTRTRGGARYALATMLLVENGHSALYASTDYDTEVWWPEYDLAKRLGEALGPYRVLRNGDYRRDFTHGVVLVNPHAHATSFVQLNGTYVGSGLGHVRKVKLQRTSGVVLLRS
jgi:Hypothetical glycosyl hydrolase family 15